MQTYNDVVFYSIALRVFCTQADNNVVFDSIALHVVLQVSVQ